MDISVIIPIYNVEEYLKECLESVLKLTKKVKSEVIMIDDGSTDNSSTIAKEYANKYDEFIYCYQENGGLGNARNNGVKLAQGKYIMFVDSDDIIEANVWKHMFDVAERNKSELTICDAVRMTGKKVSSSDPFLYCFNNLTETKTHITKHPEFVYDTTAWNKLILRSFYLEKEMQFAEGVLYEDVLWAITMHCYAKEVSVVNEIGYYWRVRTGNNLSITQRKTEKKNLIDKINAFQKVFDFFDEVVCAPAVRLMLERCQWGFNYTGHLKTIEMISEQDGMEYIKLFAEFIRKNMTQDGYESIPLIHQQIVHDVLAHDRDHLIRVLNYNKANYPNAPVVNREMLLSDEIFTISNRSIKNEFGKKPARCMIDSGAKENNKMVLECHVYDRKINIPLGTQKVNTYLWNLLDGKKYELPTKVCESHWLTEAQGTVINCDDYRTYHYDYGGAGFVIEIDLEKLDEQNLESGLYKIIVEYENDIIAGKRILGGVKKGECTFLKGLSYKGANSELKIELDKRDIILFTVSDVIPEETE